MNLCLRGYLRKYTITSKGKTIIAMIGLDSQPGGDGPGLPLDDFANLEGLAVTITIIPDRLQHARKRFTSHVDSPL